LQSGIFYTAVTDAKRCYWHNCATYFIENLHESEAIFEKAVYHGPGKVDEEIKTEVENLVTGSL
jgi:hypothetical protein